MEENLTEKVDGIAIGRKIARTYMLKRTPSGYRYSEEREYYKTGGRKLMVNTKTVWAHNGVTQHQTDEIERSEFAYNLLKSIHKEYTDDYDLKIEGTEIYGRNGLEYKILIEKSYKEVLIVVTSDDPNYGITKETTLKEFDCYEYNLFRKRKGIHKIKTLLKDKGRPYVMFGGDKKAEDCLDKFLKRI